MAQKTNKQSGLQFKIIILPPQPRKGRENDKESNKENKYEEKR